MVEGTAEGRRLPPLSRTGGEYARRLRAICPVLSRAARPGSEERDRAEQPRVGRARAERSKGPRARRARAQARAEATCDHGYAGLDLCRARRRDARRSASAER